MASTQLFKHEKIEARKKQIRNAYFDPSPRLRMARSSGLAQLKRDHLAADIGAPMMLSQFDLTKGQFIFGAHGSGKSSNIRSECKQWYDNKMGGMLILDGKGALPLEMRSIIDVMIENGANIAPFQGQDGDDVAWAFISTMGATDPKNIHWRKGAENHIRAACCIHYALHTHELHKQRIAKREIALLTRQIDLLVVTAALEKKRGENNARTMFAIDEKNTLIGQWTPHLTRQWYWNPITLKKVIMMMNTLVKQNDIWTPCDEMMRAADDLGYRATPERIADQEWSIHPETLRMASGLDEALRFAMVEWPNTGADQRPSFFGNVTTAINPLMQSGDKLRNKDGVAWVLLEKGDDYTSCLYGKSVGVAVPDQAGLVMSTLAKQRIYKEIKARNQMGGVEVWKAMGQTPLMIVADESHMLISEQEAELAPICRSAQCSLVFSTQSYDQLVTSLSKEIGGGETATTAFLLAFSSLECLRSTVKTYEYMRERIGLRSLTDGLDPYLEELKSIHGHKANNPKHPDFHIMRNGEDFHRESKTRIQGKGFKEQPLFSLGEIQAYVELEQGNALVYNFRAGFGVADLAALEWIGPDDLKNKPLLITHEHEQLLIGHDPLAGSQLYDIVISDQQNGG